MIVTIDNFRQVLADLKGEHFLAVDTETTGLDAYVGHELFSIIIASSLESYYFNFKDYEEMIHVLPKEDLKALNDFFSNWDRTYFLHNSKFDLHMLYKAGITLKGKIHDTEMTARLLYNQHMTYSLADCAKRIGLAKSEAVDKYIAEHKLFTEVVTPEGKKKKVPHFDRVPFEIISAYGMQDGRVTYALGMHQLAQLQIMVLNTPANKPSPLSVYKNDCALVPTVFHMERHGIKINREYVQAAYYYEMDRANQLQAEFEDLSGIPLVDSAKSLKEAFAKVGEKPGETEKGNPSFKSEVLEAMETPLASVLLRYRGAMKLANTYYANFLSLADSNDLIHCNMRLAGTTTGRLSCANPNLQNLAKEEDTSQPFTVRRSFVPRPDYCFVMIDYQAAEYRLLLDVASQTDVSHAVIGGLDVHQATANMMQVTRSEAKTLNFMLLYGGGTAKLAKTLGISLGKATELKNAYFSAMPAVTKWSNAVKNAAESYKSIVNWAGFVCQFPDANHCYAAPNHLIQGGCAQIIRFAMPKIHNYLVGKKSRMLLQVHDEIILEMHKDEFALIPQIVKYMEDAYPYKLLPQACEVSHSWISWGDKSKGYPS